MDFSSINFDTYWKLFGSIPAIWVIYNEDASLMIFEEYHAGIHCPNLSKSLEVEINSSSWSISVFHRKPFCWSLFLTSFIKNILQHRFFSVKFAKDFSASFHRAPPVAASARPLSILPIWEFILILEDSMWLQLIYFLNRISFWFVECLFLIDGAIKLNLIYSRSLGNI